MILSIETSTKVCSVALHSKGVLLAESTLFVDKSHSEKLAILIKNILSYADITSKNLEAVAIASGPGSYTGLRIGASTAKGLCYALDIPLIAINTLEAMVRGASEYITESNTLICPMLDARRMEVYSILATTDLTILQPTAAKIIDEHSYEEELTKSKIVFFGNGASKCESIIGHNQNALFIKVQGISATHVGDLAWRKYQTSSFEDLAYFEPEYLKEFKAVKPKNLFA